MHLSSSGIRQHCACAPEPTRCSRTRNRIGREKRAIHPHRAGSPRRLNAGQIQAPTPVPGVAHEPPFTTVGSPASLHLKANQQATPRNAFTELIATSHLSPWFLLTAALIAVGLGALHAFEPGHGKTIVAAYLVGSRGTAHHAILLGSIVTVSHTAGVFVLGAVTLTFRDMSFPNSSIHG
jgi:hypothetical protein